MDVTHLHLILNHAPVAATFFGLSIFLLSFWRKELRLAAFLLYIIAGVSVIPVYLTGDAAEDSASEQIGQVLEEHEESAENTLAAILSLGVVATLATIFSLRGSRYVNQFTIITTLLAVLSLIS